MNTRRYTIDLDKRFDSRLAELAQQKGTTKAEIIKRALATYSVITGSVQAPDNSDKKLSITNQDDKVLEDIVIP